MNENEPISEWRLTPSELELLRTALELLESTLSREQAEELAEVKQLLAKMPQPQR